MKKNAIRLFLLCLALCLCLPHAAAAAAGGAPETDAGEPSPAPEAAQSPERAEADAEDSAPEAQAADGPPEKGPAAEPQAPGPVQVGPGDAYYASAEDTVYNNAGTVYNNGGVVYNNAGTVFSNGGTVYNNGGVVYGNGGVVYNNAGTVYSNGAQVIFPEEQGAALAPGVGRVRLPEGIEAFAEVTGLQPEQGTGAYLLKEDAACVITPHKGYVLAEREVTGGRLTEREDGAWLLTLTEREAALALRFQPEAPAFSLAPGTYGQEQTVELTGPDGAEIRYTTDGSDPGPDSPLYEGPVAVEEGLTLRAVALAEGAEPSPIAEADYAVVAISAPRFEPAREGYAWIAPQPVTVVNGGGVNARIAGMRLSGLNADSFVLESSPDRQVPAGTTDTRSWTLQPRTGLKAGTYTATITAVFDSGAELELTAAFAVTAEETEPPEDGAAPGTESSHP